MPQNNEEIEGSIPHADEVPSFGYELGELDAEQGSGSNTPEDGVDSTDGASTSAPSGEGEGSGQDESAALAASKRKRGGKLRAGALSALGLGGGVTGSHGRHAVQEQSVDAVESDDADEMRRARRQRPKKPNEKLDSVIPESVAGPAISMISQCSAFEYAPDKFATLMLDTDAIGGLNKKNQNDAVKGTVIQAMTNDRISIVTLGEMYANDMLVIIPNDSTIQMMEEFNILVKAPYTWCIVDTSSKSAFVAEGVAPATFEECREIALGTMNVTEVIDAAIAKHAESGTNGEHAGTTSSDSSHVGGSTKVDTADAQDDAPEFVEEPEVDEDEVYDGPPEDAYGEPSADEFGDPEAGADDEQDVPVAPVVPTEDLVDDYGSQDHVGSEYGDDELDEEDDDPQGHLDDDVVTEEEMQAAVLRRFRDTRLDFDVTTEDFENVVGAFDTSTPFLPVETDSREEVGGSWLADIVAAQTDAANGEIASLHESNVAAARRLYVSLMSQGIVKIAEDTSMDNPQTLFGELKVTADEDYRSQLNRADVMVSAEIKRLDTEFDKGLESAAAAAAESAKVRFREENKNRLEREKQAAPGRLTSMLEEMYEGRIASIAEDRRNMARSHLDVLSNQSLAALSPMLEEHREAELALAKDWSARIVKTVDENLKADLARTQTVQEDLDRSDRIQKLTDAHQQELAAKSSDYQRELAEVNSRLVEAEARAQSSLDGLRASLQARIDESESNARAAQERIQALESERATIVESMDARRAQEVRAAKDAHAADIMSFNQRWASTIMVRRLLYIVVAALIILVGIAMYILGLHNGSSAFIDVNIMNHAFDHTIFQIS